MKTWSASSRAHLDLNRLPGGEGPQKEQGAFGAGARTSRHGALKQPREQTCALGPGYLAVSESSPVGSRGRATSRRKRSVWPLVSCPPPCRLPPSTLCAAHERKSGIWGSIQGSILGEDRGECDVGRAGGEGRREALSRRRGQRCSHAPPTSSANQKDRTIPLVVLQKEERRAASLERELLERGRRRQELRSREAGVERIRLYQTGACVELCEFLKTGRMRCQRLRKTRSPSTTRSSLLILAQQPPPRSCCWPSCEEQLVSKKHGGVGAFSRMLPPRPFGLVSSSPSECRWQSVVRAPPGSGVASPV